MKESSFPPASERINRLRYRYQTGHNYISIERAKLYTDSWKQTEGQGLSLAVRIALAMKNVYENMTIYLDPDDHIAGSWTEYFLGYAIEIERGVLNKVLETELASKTMFLHRVKTTAKALSYMTRKRKLREFVKNQRIARSAGAQPMNMELKTMSKRKINPFQIPDRDRECLLKDLLPYWKGRALLDVLEQEMSHAGLVSKDMHDFVLGVVGNTSRQAVMLSTCATFAGFQAHIILDYDKVLDQGFLAIKDRIVKARQDGNNTKEEDEFLYSLELALDGVIIFAKRLARRIEAEAAAEDDPSRKQVLERMLANCRQVPLEPARTFREAIQSMWTFKTAVEIAHPFYLNDLGRVDQDLYPYYRRDVDEGAITPDEARELIEELQLKIMTHQVRPETNLLSNFHQRFSGATPMTLGGVTPQGEDATNDLTYLFVQAAHNSKAAHNCCVRVTEKTPDDLLMLISECLRGGTSSYALYNDELHIEAMKKRGFSEEDARDFAIIGCVEATCPGRTGNVSVNALQLSRLLDITLRSGDSKLLAGTIKGDGLRTGDPDSFASFDQFLDALMEQARYFIEKLVEGSNLRDRLYAQRLPAPHISAFVEGCLENKKDSTQGSCKYEMSGISFVNSIANLVDSLYVIKKLIFEQRKFTFKQLLEAVDENFVGHEHIHREIMGLSGKWGNGQPETDQLAHDVMKRLFAETYKYKSFRGGPFVAYVISMTTHTIEGRWSIASPDGRRAATPYAASCNPYNVERSGVTAVLRSVAALPFEDVTGSAVNIKFHPSGIGKSPEARAKWVSLVRAYFQMGGSQIQPTVVSAEMLRNAKRDPENYMDLTVKVGGYSVYFTEIGREIQDEIISRTEHC
jgi:formate C-acetyltransferase